MEDKAHRLSTLKLVSTRALPELLPTLTAQLQGKVGAKDKQLLEQARILAGPPQALDWSLPAEGAPAAEQVATGDSIFDIVGRGTGLLLERHLRTE